MRGSGEMRDSVFCRAETCLRVGTCTRSGRCRCGYAAEVWLRKRAEQLRGLGGEQARGLVVVELDEQDMRRLDGATQLAKLTAPAEH